MADEKMETHSMITDEMQWELWEALVEIALNRSLQICVARHGAINSHLKSHLYRTAIYKKRLKILPFLHTAI